MTTEVTRNEQTRFGRFVSTKRVWIAENGHNVTVTTDSCINSRATWSDRSNAYARVSYKCECGREFSTKGSPKKSTLAQHDSWYTKEEVAQIVKAIGA